MAGTSAGTADGWGLYDGLIRGVPEGLVVRRCQIGVQWIAVESAGVGMSMTPGDAPTFHGIGAIAGRAVRDVAAYAKSWNFLEAAIGVAALNSWYNAPSTLARSWRRGADSPADRNVFDEWRARLAGRRVAVIGHFPSLERVAGTCELSVVERKPQPGDYPDTACEFLLPEQDVIVATGTTLVNKTLPRLLELSRGKEFALTGPTTPLAPGLLDAGVTQLAGSVVVDPDEVWRFAAEGGSRQLFKHGMRMLMLSRDDL